MPWSCSANRSSFSSFLFYGSGDHRDLHSFPTRRSSDLAAVDLGVLAVLVAILADQGVQALPRHPDVNDRRPVVAVALRQQVAAGGPRLEPGGEREGARSEEHTSELQSHSDLVCRLLLEK